MQNLVNIYLYKATKEGDKWVNAKPLPFNNKEYDVRNPSISKDGKTLYFIKYARRIWRRRYLESIW